MRTTQFIAVASALLMLNACQNDQPLAPTPGHSDRNPDIPSDLFADYSVVGLSGPGTVVDLNDAGDAVGVSNGGGVIWSGSAHTRSDLPLIPVAIANDGTIAGNLDGHAAVLRNGSLETLDTATSTARAICRSASTTVVGSVVVNGQQHAAIWTDGIRIDAGVPPGGTSAEFTGVGHGFVAGNADVPTTNPATGDTHIATQAFTWSHAGGWHQLTSSGALTSFVAGVNNRGTAVGGEDEVLFDDPIGVIFDSTGVTFQLLPETEFTREIIPAAVNDSGTIAANFPDLSPGPIALVYSLTARVLPPGNSGDAATSINSSGVIGGTSGGKPVLWLPNF